MHKLTEIEIVQKRKQYSKERDEEWNRIVRSSAAAGNLLSGNTIFKFLKTGFRYIDIILNAAYSVETAALLKSRALQPDEYFMNLKDKLLQLTEEESGIVRSKALAQFRAMGDGIQKEIVAQASRQTVELRELILTHVERIKEQVKLDLSQETPIKKDPLVFISYDTRDIELPHALAAIIKRIFADRIRTFIAKRDIKAGDDAFKTMLHDSLAKSAILLAICTKRSLTSPWLWFESGAGFGTGTLIPIWAGVKPEEFKAPMAIFQGKSIEDKAEMEELITRIAEVAKVTCADCSLTAEELDSLKRLVVKLKNIGEKESLFDLNGLSVSELKHPDLRDSHYSNCVLWCSAVNTSGQMVTINKVLAFDSKNELMPITWSNRINELGNPLDSSGLIGIKDTASLYLRHNHGTDIFFCRLEIYHSLSDKPILKTFDEFSDRES